jgi:hypothetical protein
MRSLLWVSARTLWLRQERRSRNAFCFTRVRIKDIHDVRGKDGVGAPNGLDGWNAKLCGMITPHLSGGRKGIHINIIDTPGHVVHCGAEQEAGTDLDSEHWYTNCEWVQSQSLSRWTGK